jgi:hypothetical protein
LEGPFATLIRDAIPGTAETDLRRAREYLNACGMVVNVRGNQRGGQPQWFIRAKPSLEPILEEVLWAAPGRGLWAL